MLQDHGSFQFYPQKLLPNLPVYKVALKILPYSNSSSGSSFVDLATWGIFLWNNAVFH